MANYPYYYPTQYNAYPTQMNVAPTQPTQNSGIIWVSGEAGAKSYLVGAGQSVLLMDAEADAFFLKSADQSGMPMIRKFRYKEEPFGATNAPIVGATEAKDRNYVSQEEFNKYKDEIETKLSQISTGAQE